MTFYNDFLRALGGEDDDGYQETYLGEYEPYSLAWRYLGMYIDCDVDEMENYEEMYYYEGSEEGSEDRNRVLSSNDGGGCSRKVLWAAYRDPKYQGGSIGEYQFYDWRTDEWDDSTCQTGRCARMNCHESRTHWKLVGVFKEDDGLEWAEQLFKHEGYCVWNDIDGGNGNGNGGSGDSGDGDSSAYNFMQNVYEDWSDYFGCTELSLTDDYGNSLYAEAKPQAGGNFTYGLYYDEDCTQPSSMTFGEYIINWYYENWYYYYYYGNGQDGYEMAAEHEQNVMYWNRLMNDFKICQPCRAYSRFVNEEDNSNDDNDDGGDDDNDGEGASEQWGYNCEDDAGYRNCNQCYKFEVKTDLEPVTAEDLARASKQGTILSIKVNGTHYGEGGFGHQPLPVDVVILIVCAVIAFVSLVVIAFYTPWGKLFKKSKDARKRSSTKWSTFHRSRQVGASASESLIDKTEREILKDLESELQQKNRMIEEQAHELSYMQAQIDNEAILPKSTLYPSSKETRINEQDQLPPEEVPFQLQHEQAGELRSEVKSPPSVDDVENSSPKVSESQADRWNSDEGSSSSSTVSSTYRDDAPPSIQQEQEPSVEAKKSPPPPPPNTDAQTTYLPGGTADVLNDETRLISENLHESEMELLSSSNNEQEDEEATKLNNGEIAPPLQAEVQSPASMHHSEPSLQSYNEIETVLDERSHSTSDSSSDSEKEESLDSNKLTSLIHRVFPLGLASRQQEASGTAQLPPVSTSEILDDRIKEESEISSTIDEAHEKCVDVELKGAERLSVSDKPIGLEEGGEATAPALEATNVENKNDEVNAEFTGVDVKEKDELPEDDDMINAEEGEVTALPTETYDAKAKASSVKGVDPVALEESGVKSPSPENTRNEVDLNCTDIEVNDQEKLPENGNAVSVAEIEAKHVIPPEKNVTAKMEHETTPSNTEDKERIIHASMDDQKHDTLDKVCYALEYALCIEDAQEFACDENDERFEEPNNTETWKGSGAGRALRDSATGTSSASNIAIGCSPTVARDSQIDEECNTPSDGNDPTESLKPIESAAPDSRQAIAEGQAQLLVSETSTTSDDTTIRIANRRDAVDKASQMTEDVLQVPRPVTSASEIPGDDVLVDRIASNIGIEKDGAKCTGGGAEETIEKSCDRGKLEPQSDPSNVSLHPDNQHEKSSHPVIERPPVSSIQELKRKLWNDDEVLQLSVSSSKKSASVTEKKQQENVAEEEEGAAENQEKLFHEQDDEPTRAEVAEEADVVQEATITSQANSLPPSSFSLGQDFFPVDSPVDEARDMLTSVSSPAAPSSPSSAHMKEVLKGQTSLGQDFFPVDDGNDDSPPIVGNGESTSSHPVYDEVSASDTAVPVSTGRLLMAGSLLADDEEEEEEEEEGEEELS